MAGRNRSGCRGVPVFYVPRLHNVEEDKAATRNDDDGKELGPMNARLHQLYHEKITRYLLLAARRNRGEDVRVELLEAEGAMQVVWALLVGMVKRSAR